MAGVPVGKGVSQQDDILTQDEGYVLVRTLLHERRYTRIGKSCIFVSAFREWLSPPPEITQFFIHRRCEDETFFGRGDLGERCECPRLQ